MLFYLDVADTLEIDPTLFWVPLAGVTVLGPSDGIKAVSWFETRVPRGLTVSYPTKEGLEGQVQTAKRGTFGVSRRA